ncbi:MAG: CoA-binding protein, partial [Verrucomicrobiales bacterium]
MALASIFSPSSIAVIGASPRAGSVGEAVMENLKTFRGAVFPVNPKHTEVGDRPAWPSVSSIGEPVDLALVVTPAPTVPGI